MKENKAVTDYWMAHYVSATHHCVLCGNAGVIDTTGIRTPAGVLVGRKSWCICPNGQRLREALRPRQPGDAINA